MPLPRLLLALLLLTATIGGTLAAASASAQPPSETTCGLSQPAFCETFDEPAGTGNRSGQLNGSVWGVSRTIGGDTNIGQGQYDAWSPTQLQSCSGTPMVQPEDDIIVCDGQLREALNDDHTVPTLAMYPKQPFDFAGRTGTIAFDVSNDTSGGHTVWPELWITDQPVPAPFTFQSSWKAAPRNGMGLRFGAATTPGQGFNLAPACPNDDHIRWSVESVVVVRNYAVDDQQDRGATHVNRLDCVIGSSGPGDMNHIEVQVAQNQIDVYATDAGTAAPLHHLAVVQNANLTLSRGLVWIEDVHYNADKDGPGKRQHTFAWDNFGFDGPVLPRDLAFDVPDALVPVAAYPGLLNLGWLAPSNAGLQLTVPEVSGLANATAALLTFNFAHESAPTKISYAVNGNAHAVAWPYPETQGYTWRTLAVPVPLNELNPGSNTVTLAADQYLIVANVDLILVGAGGPS